MYVVDQRAAAKLTTSIEQNRCPRPFIGIRVLTADDFLLILKQKFLISSGLDRCCRYLEAILGSTTASIEANVVDER